MINKSMFFLLFNILSFGCSNFTEKDPNEEAKLSLSFQNNSIYKLENIIVAEKSIGSLESYAKTKYITFDNFGFDTGMPDENASAEIDGELFTNHFRGFWCGTEKMTVDSGKYLIEIEVVDTMLFLSCENAPTIFD